MTGLASPAWRIRGDAGPEEVLPTLRDAPYEIFGIDLDRPPLPWLEVGLICGMISASYINGFLIVSG